MVMLMRNVELSAWETVTFQGSDTAFPRGRDGYQALQVSKPVAYTHIHVS